MKNVWKSDDGLPLKNAELYNMVIAAVSVFYEKNKYYP